MTYSYSASPSTNSHRFRVRANNSAGASDWSYTDTVYTDPRSLTVDAVRESEIDLSWTGVRDAVEYEVLRAESSGSVVSDYAPVGTAAGVSYTDAGLENGEAYYYRVRAVYSGTDSQPTNEDSGTTTLPDPTLDAIDDTVLRELTLEYTLPDNSTDGTMTIERSDDGGSTWSTIATVSDLALTLYTDAGLPDGEQYTYRLTRSTDHASAQSGTATAVTVLPAPTNLAHPAVGDATVEYAWSATHNNGSTRVEYREAGASAWQTYATVSNTTESETVDGLLNGEAYESRVVAQTTHAETEDQ
ncbi:fibronectin type III domain-containing protein [Halorubrum ejinorense]